MLMRSATTDRPVACMTPNGLWREAEKSPGGKRVQVGGGMDGGAETGTELRYEVLLPACPIIRTIGVGLHVWQAASKQQAG